jgi:hypothetical protein
MTELYQPTEEDFHKAVNNASYFSRRRLNKKMNKLKKRAAEWLPYGKPKVVVSPLTGENIRLNPGEVRRKLMPPADLEQWVTNFCLNNKDKEANEKV